jgi:FdhE protein
MGMTETSRLLTPEEIAVRAGQQVPFIRLPERASVFADREMRLRERSASHPMRDFLLFMAELARVQHQTLQSYGRVAMPDAAAIDAASREGAAPLAAAHWPRDPIWRGQLRALLERLELRLQGSPAQAAVANVRALGNDALEQQADRLLNGVMLGLDLAAAPLIAAGLQTYWTELVLQTEQTRGADRLAPFGRTDDPGSCPCCASRPTASVSRIGADASGYRYLHCSLCSVQWHMVRIKCSHCQGTKGIEFRSLLAAGDTTAAANASTTDTVQAETCDTCHHYLKMVRMERDPHVEPVADDLASLTLDLLVSDAGYERHGVNLMLLFGDPGGS